MHEHTAYFDGTPLTRPADMYRRVKDMGYDVAAPADHSDNLGISLSTGIGRAECPQEKFLYCLFLVDEERPQDALAKWAATLSQSEFASTDGFTAIRGFEWTSDRFGHANVYFSRNTINAKMGPGYAVSMALLWQWFSYPAQLGGGSDGLLSFNHPGREDALESAFEFASGDPDLPKTVIRALSHSLDDLREALLARRVYVVAQHYSGLRLDYRIANPTFGARLRRPQGSALPYRVSVAMNGQVMSAARVQLVGPENTVLAEGVGGELQGELAVRSSKKLRLCSRVRF